MKLEGNDLLYGVKPLNTNVTQHVTSCHDVLWLLSSYICCSLCAMVNNDTVHITPPYIPTLWFHLQNLPKCNKYLINVHKKLKMKQQNTKTFTKLNISKNPSWHCITFIRFAWTTCSIASFLKSGFGDLSF